MKKDKTEIKNKKTEKISKTSNSDVRIGANSYTEEDMIFIANKFIQMGLNIQSIIQVMKEEEVKNAFANNLHMQEELQKLYKEKEKMIDLEDLQKKLLKIENIKVAVRYPDVFQISIIEMLK